MRFRSVPLRLRIPSARAGEMLSVNLHAPRIFSDTERPAQIRNLHIVVRLQDAEIDLILKPIFFKTQTTDAADAADAPISGPA